MALSPERVRRFYDRFSPLQDTQAFYEDPAIDDLITHAAFERAHRVVEIGCGTGRLARRLLDRHLPADATYLGLELSPRMAQRAAHRLQPHTPRAQIAVTDAVHDWPAAGDGADRVIATYLFDLLDPAATTTLLDHINGALVGDGLLCTASLTDGPNGLARATTRAWTAIWKHWPGLVGGCRPITLNRALTQLGWNIQHHTTVTAWALTSEVVVAERTP